jgi:hypothetical protein
LRQLLTFFILISFLGQTFSQVFIVADYYFNTASFAKNCENKDKPKLHCNGKCQLMKKMKQEEKKDQQNPERKIEYKNITISSKSFFVVALPVHFSSVILFPALHVQVATDRSTDIFHPPKSLHDSNNCV